MITIEQMDIMTHALGRSHIHKGLPLGWRNHYNAHIGHIGCGALVDEGLMREGYTTSEMNRNYHVTQKGIDFLRERGFTINLR